MPGTAWPSAIHGSTHGWTRAAPCLRAAGSAHHGQPAPAQRLPSQLAPPAPPAPPPPGPCSAPTTDPSTGHPPALEKGRPPAAPSPATAGRLRAAQRRTK